VVTDRGRRVALFNPASVTVTRYRYWGEKAPTPCCDRTTPDRTRRGEPGVEADARFDERPGETDQQECRYRAQADSTSTSPSEFGTSGECVGADGVGVLDPGLTMLHCEQPPMHVHSRGR
jgi:hypothetical protein